jgi:hypothetical protein
MVFLVFFGPEHFLKVSQKSNKPTHSIFCDIAEWLKTKKWQDLDFILLILRPTEIKLA